MHGYDTVDYTQVSAECGGEAGLKRLVDKLRAHDMGLLVDMVPNHMGVGGASTLPRNAGSGECQSTSK
jgi:(1->4)-alpha-D-glucan 1-alpha-D-glucosylmutase